MSKVAIVTGANKGIGFSVVKGLCQRFDGIVYLTARDVARGEQAVKELESIGLQPKFHQLDITDQQSIENFRDFIKSNHDGIDILINNAATAFKGNATETAAEQAKITLEVNYFSLLKVCDALFPLIKKNGKVIHLSSIAGHLSMIPSKDLREQFGSADLTVAGLSALANKYIEATKAGTQVADGWGNNSYVVSKVAVSALTFIQQKEWESKEITVNCVHPGYVATDMSSHKGFLQPDRGAVSTLFAALDVPNSLKAKIIWDNNDIVDWYAEKAPSIAKE